MLEQTSSSCLNSSVSEDIPRLLHTLIAELAKLEHETKTCLIDIRNGPQQRVDSFQYASLKKSINELKSELDIIERNIVFKFGVHWQNIKDQMIDLKSAAINYQGEGNRLKVLCQNKEEIIQNLEEKIGKFNRASSDQNSFLATKLGSVLSNYLWKLSQNGQIVKILVNSGTLTTLFEIIDDSLKLFFHTHGNEELPAKNPEMRCLTSLIGIVLNVAATYEGRKYIIVASQGQEMIRSIVQYVRKFPNSWAQRLMLMVIFNVSINDNGTKIVVEEPCLFDAIKRNLVEAPESIKYVSLKLLYVIVCNTKNWKHMTGLKDQIPLSLLNEIEKKSCSDEERKLICDIRRRYVEITPKN